MDLSRCLPNLRRASSERIGTTYPYCGYGYLSRASTARREIPFVRSCRCDFIGYMKFVGRNRQLAQLATAVASASQGDGRFVLIRGEASIGKTTLLKTFLDGHVNDVDLLHGACEHLTTHRPLQPF